MHSAELVVVSFNIRNDRGPDGRHIWWLRRDATAAAIRSPGPDVAGLQEVRPLQLHYLQRELPDYAFLSRGRDRQGTAGEHCPILYRRDRFLVETWEVRWFAATQTGRIATIARLADQSDGGRVFGVVNTHLDHGSAAGRATSMETLLGWLATEPRPWVIMGDLNATADEASVAKALTAGYRDALAGFPLRGSGAATTHRFTGSADGRRIDHILTGPGVEVTDAFVQRSRPGGKLPSDHWPVVARLRVEPGVR